MIRAQCTCGKELKVDGVFNDKVRVEPCTCMIPKPVEEKHILNKGK